jgi:sortase A
MEQALFLGGFACLALFLWTAGERAWFQHRYLRELSGSSDAEATSALDNAAALRSGPLGRIEIPRTKVSAAILDGVDAGTLDRAVGHVPGTAFPGEASGRVALAAHRDTFFRNLDDLKIGDTIRLEVVHRMREYKVESTEVVKPDQTEVLAPTRDSLLTLITCYPFEYLGTAPERFIVHARLVGNP